MKITPNATLLTGIAGRLGGIVLQPLRTAHIARRAWTIRAPVTDPQAAHRLAFSRAAALYQSAPDALASAWTPYAEAQGYGAYAAWQHLNTPPLKVAAVTCLAPPNAAYTPLTDPDWQTGLQFTIDASWTYVGPAATVYVSTFYRLVDSYAWAFDATVDATAEERTIPGLLDGHSYEVALIAHDAAHTTWSESYHEYCDAGVYTFEDFLTFDELDPNERITLDHFDSHAVDLTRNEEARVWQDKGEDFFGTDWTHTFRFDFAACDDNGAAIVWAVSSMVADATYWLDNQVPALEIATWRNPAGYYLNLKNTWDNEEHYFDDYTCPGSYWITVERVAGTTLTAKVYTDAERTNLFHTHTITPPADQLHRHLFVCNTLYIGGNNRCSFHTRDLHIDPHV